MKTTPVIPHSPELPPQPPPLDSSQPSPPPTPSAPTMPSSSRQILVVDDDAGVALALCEALEIEGYNCIGAPSAERALLALENTHVDLVLLDLNLQGKSGWDLLEHLYIRSPLVPVIVITAQPNQILAAVCAGVGALLEKPLRIPVLLETVELLLREPEEVRRLRRCGESAAFRYSTPSGGLISLTHAVPRPWGSERLVRTSK